MVNGIKQKPIEGVSMAYTFDRRMPRRRPKRDTQYFEMVGNRGIYHDGWMASTTPSARALAPGHGQAARVVDDYKWELYNLDEGLLPEQRPRGARCRTS